MPVRPALLTYGGSYRRRPHFLLGPVLQEGSRRFPKETFFSVKHLSISWTTEDPFGKMGFGFFDPAPILAQLSSARLPSRRACFLGTGSLDPKDVSFLNRDLKVGGSLRTGGMDPREKPLLIKEYAKNDAEPLPPKFQFDSFDLVLGDNPIYLYADHWFFVEGIPSSTGDKEPVGQISVFAKFDITYPSPSD